MMIHHRFRADPHRALCRALAALLDAKVTGLADDPWASVTFEGRQHRLLVTGAGLSDGAAGLADIEFAIPGHIVASIAVIECGARARGDALVIEALTLKDA